MAAPRVKIYTKTGCPYCARALAILREHNVPFEEVNIAGREELRDEIEELTGERSVPQVFVDGVHIGDDDALAEWAEEGKLDALRG